MISATALIVKHLGVTSGVAVAIKYGAIAALVSGTLLWMKADYDADRRQEGYDACKLEQVVVVDRVKDAANEVKKERHESIREDKTEQRGVDTVTRKRYNDLKQERDSDRINFERILQKAKSDSVNCANVAMPDSLQRRVGTQ